VVNDFGRGEAGLFLSRQNTMKKILIIDDEKTVRESFSRVMKLAGFLPVPASNGNEGIHTLKKNDISAILLDNRMPDMSGMEALKQIKKINSIVPVFVVTGHGDIRSAVEAMKLGAQDFVTKPPDFDRLILSINSAIEKMELEKEVKRLHAVLDSSLEKLLGRSKAINEIKEMAKKVAGSNFSVIIQGETGTGKTTLAREIHNLSNRSGKSFVKVDVGALTESLTESDLFGHEKGAFTGAEKRRKGFFEMADRGTIFLDEIGNMSLSAQAKLLQVLEEKSLYPVGSSDLLKVDLRFIVATHGDIEKLVREKKMREDLFYRLSEFTITIPPLRERSEDIQYFALKFFEDARNELDVPVKELSNEAMGILMSYSWPGNIRELKTVIRKAVLISEERTLNAEYIKSLIGKTIVQGKNSMVLPFKETMKFREIEIIKNAIKIAEGNKTKAAAMLKMSYRNFLAKTKEYGIKS